jgi:hypothetical protein
MILLTSIHSGHSGQSGQFRNCVNKENAARSSAERALGVPPCRGSVSLAQPTQGFPTPAYAKSRASQGPRFRAWAKLCRASGAGRSGVLMDIPRARAYARSVGIWLGSREFGR